MEEAGKNWRTAFMPRITALFQDVAEMNSAALGMRFDVENFMATEWVQDYYMVFAQPAMDTTIADLQKLIAQAEHEGWGIDEISKQIGATFDYYLDGANAASVGRLSDEETQWFLDRQPRPRRDNIARTETMRASNAGSFELYKASGVVEYKEWIATHDRRTRPSHVRAEAEYGEAGSIGPIPMDQPFVVGGYQMMYPLDGSLGADISEIASCRCAMAPVLYEPGEMIEQGTVEVPQYNEADFRSIDHPNDARPWGQEQFGEWEAGLSRDQVRALLQYARHGTEDYHKLNSYLRGQTATEEAEALAKDLVGRIDSTITAPLPEDMVIWRGANKSGAFADPEALVGHIIEDAGYVSTSVVEGRAASYAIAAERGGEEPLMVKILAPKGTDVAYLEDIQTGPEGGPSEFELLLARGSKFRVVDYRGTVSEERFLVPFHEVYPLLTLELVNE